MPLVLSKKEQCIWCLMHWKSRMSSSSKREFYCGFFLFLMFSRKYNFVTSLLQIEKAERTEFLS